ncbi:hypothetical protein [uncultured Thermanaerothrix sp.]|uniref:hypothetical protein n=1 Tax=uncultured Thermanaerothrix sp. TaxID=1195149 RepID=UPI002606CD2F|nr:hypothetical protein [uncultured Thermanaerothrix sp.]
MVKRFYIRLGLTIAKMALFMGLWFITTAHVSIPNPIRDPGLAARGNSETITWASLDLTALQTFRDHLTLTGDPQQPMGLYVEGVMAYPIIQQPRSNPAYVSSQPNTLTEFALAKHYGSLGLLAHNDLAGQSFLALQPGQDLWVVFGDGNLKRYRVATIKHYQALQPNSPYSSFINIDDKDRTVLSAAELFLHIYERPGALILQTCLARNGNNSWGRLFVIALPEETTSLSIPPE